MAVQMNYLAPKGWQPSDPDEEYVLVQFKLQLATGVPEEKFSDAAATVAAESSTGTWTKVESSKDSGIAKAEEYKAVVYDLDKKNHLFKVAYKIDLFEMGNISGFLAGPIGNVGGMKMVRGLRILDIRFPRRFVQSFPGPRYGIDGVRDLLEQNSKQRQMPIIGTVPKPKVGRNAEEMALLAKRLWMCGDGTFDFIKDDENLTSLAFNSIEERIKKVLSVQKEAEKVTGHKKLYLCNITHSNIDIMLKRARLIKKAGGLCMMMDVITTGFAAVHTIRLKNPGLIIHAHRAMHAFFTRESGNGVSGVGEIEGFSVSMIVLAKLLRLLGVDSLHSGTPKGKMEDYGEAKEVMLALISDKTAANPRFHTLGQKWFGMKKVWPVASGGLHPGVMDKVIETMGKDCYIQLGGGVLGHPEGAEQGAQAALEARSTTAEGISIKKYAKAHPNSALAKAVIYWGTEPKVVY